MDAIAGSLSYGFNPMSPAKKLFMDFTRSVGISSPELLQKVQDLAFSGEGNCQSALCWYYLKRKPGSPENLALAKQWGERAVTNGFKDVLYHLAWVLWEQDPADPGIRSNLRKAARDAGTLRTAAACDLGVAYEQGIGGNPSSRWARHWYMVAAAQGDAIARRNLKKLDRRRVRTGWMVSG